MARFEFRLKTLLAMRQAELDEQHGLLAAAFAAERILQARRAELVQRCEEQARLSRSGAARGPLDVDLLRAAGRYTLVLRGQMEALAAEEQTVAAEIDRLREAVVDADCEVKMLEKLRERQQAAFRQHQAVVEINETDEVAARSSAPHDRA